MRQLLVQVPRGYGKAVLKIATAYDAVNLAQFEAIGSDGPIDLAIAHISNRKIEEFLTQLQSLPHLHVTLIPQGVIALQPPPVTGELPDLAVNLGKATESAS